MRRRSFLGAILALGAAPAIVRADSLMRIVVPGDTYVLWTDFNALWSEHMVRTLYERCNPSIVLNREWERPLPMLSTGWDRISGITSYMRGVEGAGRVWSDPGVRRG